MREVWDNEVSSDGTKFVPKMFYSGSRSCSFKAPHLFNFFANSNVCLIFNYESLTHCIILPNIFCLSMSNFHISLINIGQFTLFIKVLYVTNTQA